MSELAICQRFGWSLQEVRALPLQTFRDIKTYLHFQSTVAAVQHEEPPHVL